MKFTFFERVIACSLLGATTVAVASGMHQVQPPKDGPETRVEQVDEVVVEEAEEPIEVTVSDVFEEIADPAASQDIREESIGKLVEAVAKASGDEKEHKKEDLKSALSNIFQKRIEVQKTRLAEMRKKLDSIEEQLDKRSSLEEQIVQRRVSELLGEADELSWDATPKVGLGNPGLNEIRLDDLARLSWANTDIANDKFRKSFDDKAKQAKSFGDAQKQFAEAQKAAGDVAKRMADAERRVTESRARLDRRGVEGTSDLNLRGELGTAMEKEFVEMQDRTNSLHKKLRDADRKQDDSQLRVLQARMKMMDEQKEQLRRELEVLSKQQKSSKTPREVRP